MKKVHSGKYNLFMVYILQAANFLFSFISYPYVTRILGAEILGEISFTNSIANYFSAIATFGITSYAVRSCAKVKADQKQLRRTADELFTANMVTTVVAIVLCASTVIVVPSIHKYWKYMILSGLAFASEFVGISWYYTAMEQFDYITVRNIILKFLSIVLIFVFVKNTSDGLIYAGILAFSVICTNIVNYLCSRRKIKISIRLSSPYARHYHKTKWFFVQSIALTVLSNMDVSMLGFMNTSVQVGNYEVALKIKLLLSSLVSSLGNVFLPRLSRYYAQEEMDAFWKTVHKSLQYNCVISLPMVGFLWICAKEIILLFCGNQYAYAADILKILVIAVFVVGLSTVTGIQVLLSIDKEKTLFWSLISGSIVNFILNLYMIPKFSGAGAAMTTLISECVILAIHLIVLKKNNMSLPLFKIIKIPFAGTLAAFIITSVATAILPLAGFYKILFSGICFAGVYSMVLGVWKEEIFMELIHMIIKEKK